MTAIVVYTTLTDNYDVLQPALFPSSDVRYVCFSDSPVKAKGWEYVHLGRGFGNARRDSRHPKIRPHLFLPDHTVSLYHDANFQLRVDPVALGEGWPEGVGLVLFRHPSRVCLYDEAAICSRLRLVTCFDKLKQQLDRYEREGMPSRWGLFHGAAMLRRHLEPSVVELSNLWWDEYTKGAQRDQITLPYALWKTGAGYRVMTCLLYACSLFSYTGHRE